VQRDQPVLVGRLIKQRALNRDARGGQQVSEARCCTEALHNPTAPFELEEIPRSGAGRGHLAQRRFNRRRLAWAKDRRRDDVPVLLKCLMEGHAV
jgi:hypothetical protein